MSVEKSEKRKEIICQKKNIGKGNKFISDLSGLVHDLAEPSTAAACWEMTQHSLGCATLRAKTN